MYIAKDYEMQLEAPPCEPGAEYWNATARFEEDLSDAFPYLNAELKNAVYSQAANQITWRYQDRAVAIRPHEITISNLPDRDAAAIEMEKVVAEINRIWMDRDHIAPLHTPRKRLVTMEIYQLLPQTNCKECGEASCFAFAGKLTVGEADAAQCTPLFADDRYAEKRQALLEMLAQGV